MKWCILFTSLLFIINISFAENSASLSYCPPMLKCLQPDGRACTYEQPTDFTIVSGEAIPFQQGLYQLSGTIYYDQGSEATCMYHYASIPYFNFVQLSSPVINRLQPDRSNTNWHQGSGYWECGKPNTHSYYTIQPVQSTYVK